MDSAIHRLLDDLHAGIAVATLRRPRQTDSNTGASGLACLFFFNTLLIIVLDYIAKQPDPDFNRYAFATSGSDLAALLFGALLVTRLRHSEKSLLPLANRILAMMPLLILGQFMIEISEPLLDSFHSSAYGWLLVLWLGWFLLALLRAAQLSIGCWSRHTLGAWLILLATYVLPGWLFSTSSEYWYTTEPYESADDEWTAYRDLDAEALFYLQPQRLRAVTDSLLTQRSDVADLYFVGFAGYARQGVFRKETEFARNLFDQRFDTAGRSLTLINHLDTLDTQPIATSHNLRDALNAVAARMDTEQDVLVLFLTSHGSKKHELSVDFWPLPLNDLTPTMLKTYLDEAGIKWRILMVSSCYSGGFIKPLETPWSWIATASAADKTSFGCSDHNDFTWFGEALLKDQMSRKISFTPAFEAAAQHIAEREKEQDLEASQPQLFVGEAMKTRLPELEASLQARHCRQNIDDECRIAQHD